MTWWWNLAGGSVDLIEGAMLERVNLPTREPGGLFHDAVHEGDLLLVPVSCSLKNSSSLSLLSLKVTSSVIQASVSFFQQSALSYSVSLCSYTEHLCLTLVVGRHQYQKMLYSFADLVLYQMTRPATHLKSY